MKIEQEAIRIVIEYEKKQGRTAKDVSKDKNEVGYDVLSDDRKIEVKGLGGRNPFILFNSYNIKAFQRLDNFYLYIVFDVKTNPKLIIYDKVKLTESLHKAKVYFEFELPLRKKDWENGKEVE